MLIPCIDLQGGQAVQLVHGRKRELAVANVLSLLEQFKKYPWLHVIDLDAAMGKRSNAKLAREVCQAAADEYGMKVRVGGGIRTVARAVTLAGWGTEQVIIGSAAFRHGSINTAFLNRLLREIPSSKIVIALDTDKGRIAIHGWKRTLELRPEEVMAQLEPFCSGFLCTDIDREGTMGGANLKWFRKLRAATTYPIIAAGGIKTRREIATLQKLVMDAAVGMAMYKNILK